MDILLRHVRPPLLRLLLCSVFALSLAAAWLYGGKDAWKTRAALRAELATLAGTGDLDSTQHALDEARASLAEQQAALEALLPAVPAPDVTLLLVELDRLAAAHTLQLLRAGPLASSARAGFTESLVEVEASGDYLALAAWVQEVTARHAELRLRSLRISAGALSEARQAYLVLGRVALAEGP